MDIYAQFLAGISVIGVLALLLWLLKRGSVLPHRLSCSGTQADKPLRALDRLSLTPQHALHLVRVGDRTVLVAVHSTGCSLIEAWPGTANPTAASRVQEDEAR